MDTVRYFKELSKARHGDSGSLMPGLQRVQHQVAIDAGYRSWGALIVADDSDRQLAVIMHKEPQLNHFGFGPGSFSGTLKERRERFNDWRSELRGSTDHVGEIREWLERHVEQRQTINPSAGSYHLKHLAEEDLGSYVANGELIAAAALAGYPYRREMGDSPNASFGMSERSLNLLRRRLRP